MNYDENGGVVNITEKYQDSASTSMNEFIIKIWQSYDSDGDGLITKDQARQFINEFVGIQDVKLDKREVLLAFEAIDLDGDDYVNIGEMLEFFKNITANNVQVFKGPDNIQG